MTSTPQPVGRIQDVPAYIKALENRLRGDRHVPPSEQAIILAEIRMLKQQQDAASKRKRQFLPLLHFSGYGAATGTGERQLSGGSLICHVGAHRELRQRALCSPSSYTNRRH